ncbi:MAG: ABC transporter permease [Pirellulales bacterium]|nr:ABC transporter permease [Pirellulales bacterium]
MYKLLLCLRYLRTRWIALASIISVTLGVATLIVVNSVMQGFTGEMKNRIKGTISDLMLESCSLSGMYDFDAHAERIMQVAGDRIEALSPMVAIQAMLYLRNGENTIVMPVDLVGIDERTQSKVSDFGKFLQHPANRRAMSFLLHEDGYDVRDHQAGDEAPPREPMAGAGWKHRREMARFREFQEKYLQRRQPQSAPPPESSTPPLSAPTRDPFAGRLPEEEINRFDPAAEQHAGIVLGMAMASFRTSDGVDHFRVLPGDDVKLTTVTVGQPPKDTSDNFTIVDFYESKMSEYDSKFVFVPIRKLQKMRGMWDPTTGVGWINAIQIKLKPGADGEAVRDLLRAAFSPRDYVVSTWRDKQGALLSAVDMETRILNILLFMIIAVAGFGILAIFYMIVVEKTRDIGILKSLGASSRGVMGIFLGYGLSLGAVGSGAGLVIGLLFVRYINEIADFIAWATGQPVFDPSIYYFYEIPAVVLPWTVFWIVCGALAIAVLASILPARRAARLHPVEALRYE